MATSPAAEIDEPPSDSEDMEWEQLVVEEKVLVDSAGMYLREIGWVRLLNRWDEGALARKIEDGRHVEKLEKELEEADGRPPKGWEECFVLLLRLGQAAPLICSVGKHLGLPSDLTLSQVTDHPKLRVLIDAKLTPDLIANVAEGMGMEGSEAEQKVRQTSLDSRVLPSDAIDMLGDCTLERLIETIKTADYYFRLQSMEVLLQSNFERIKEVGQRAQRHLIEANLRLVAFQETTDRSV